MSFSHKFRVWVDTGDNRTFAGATLMIRLWMLTSFVIRFAVVLNLGAASVVAGQVGDNGHPFTTLQIEFAALVSNLAGDSRHGNVDRSANFASGAQEFPVSGDINIHGAANSVGAGAVFVSERFDAGNGTLGPGAFVTPQRTQSISSPLGLLTVTYELVQTNTSTVTVTADTAVTVTDVLLRLDIVHAELDGSSLPLGSCSAGPIIVQFTGTVETKGTQIHDDQFSIPGFSGCGLYGSLVNLFITGDNNATLFIAGDFLPTSANAIFIDWFEP